MFVCPHSYSGVLPQSLAQLSTISEKLTQIKTQVCVRVCVCSACVQYINCYTRAQYLRVPPTGDCLQVMWPLQSLKQPFRWVSGSIKVTTFCSLLPRWTCFNVLIHYGTVCYSVTVGVTFAWANKMHQLLCFDLWHSLWYLPNIEPEIHKATTRWSPTPLTLSVSKSYSQNLSMGHPRLNLMH